jgi:hypothetical protein
MKLRVHVLASTVWMLVSIGLVGCSTDLSNSPVGPSALAVPLSSGSMTAASHGGSSNGGGGTDDGRGHDAGDDQQKNEAEFNGVVSALSGTCPSLRLTVGATRVATSPDTVFDGLACGGLKSGQSVEINGTTLSDGSVAAARVRFEGPEIEVEPNDAEVVGGVGGRIGTCPALSFTVGATRVITNAATTFEDVACNALANGDQVEVNGAFRDGGTLVAARVERRR